MNLMGKSMSDERREQALKLLRQTFGLNEFRKGQWQVVENILKGKTPLLFSHRWW